MTHALTLRLQATLDLPKYYTATRAARESSYASALAYRRVHRLITRELAEAAVKLKRKSALAMRWRSSLRT
ncbi:MAG: hypothetical protein U1A72_02045 [Sulfuritalea sp.]|nr:hypothetical protein [Sulfuritalea sp.]